MIFDLDGVIVDTAKYHFLAWKRLTDELEIPFTEKDNERLKGVSRMASLDILLELGNKTATDDEKLAMATRKNDWYVDFISKMEKSEILPGVESFLQEARSRGIKVALGSASKNAMRILTGLDLVHYFDSIIDGTKVQKAKPDPEVFLLGAETLGLNPEDCIVFEDAKAGVEAAKAGGMKAIAIGTIDELPGADCYYDGIGSIDMDTLFTQLKG